MVLMRFPPELTAYVSRPAIARGCDRRCVSQHKSACRSYRDVSSVTKQRPERSVVVDAELAVAAGTRRRSLEAEGRRTMRSHILFAGLGMLIYVVLAYAEATSSGFSSAFFAL